MNFCLTLKLSHRILLEWLSEVKHYKKFKYFVFKKIPKRTKFVALYCYEICLLIIIVWSIASQLFPIVFHQRISPKKSTSVTLFTGEFPNMTTKLKKYFLRWQILSQRTQGIEPVRRGRSCHHSGRVGKQFFFST